METAGNDKKFVFNNSFEFDFSKQTSMKTKYFKLKKFYRQRLNFVKLNAK